MTNDKRVFCKDCEWIKPGNAWRCGEADCIHENSIIRYNPVHGLPYYTDCSERNKNCDCPDYQAKESE